DAEVLEIETQGERLGALKASVSTERAAARAVAVFRLGAGLDEEHLEPPAPTVVIPPAPSWKSKRPRGTGGPAIPTGAPTAARQSDPRDGEAARVGTDSETSAPATVSLPARSNSKPFPASS